MKSIQLLGGHISTIEAMERNFGLFQFPRMRSKRFPHSLGTSISRSIQLWTGNVEPVLEWKAPMQHPIKIKKLTNKQVFTYCRAS